MVYINYLYLFTHTGVQHDFRVEVESCYLLYRVHLACAGFELKTLMVIDTDCIYTPCEMETMFDTSKRK
jgi:hypothetical protein